YKFNVRSSNTFVAGDGKATMVTVVGYEKGGVTTTMEDKPDIKFNVSSMNPEAVGAAPVKK
ncbi:MAG TPA: dihydrolipoamide acetyltransferase, partial [Polyangia bacterium]|nr:dihydrolipoamide acetyltransferase [Polyangia bacterium]